MDSDNSDKQSSYDLVCVAAEKYLQHTLKLTELNSKEITEACRPFHARQDKHRELRQLSHRIRELTQTRGQLRAECSAMRQHMRQMLALNLKCIKAIDDAELTELQKAGIL